MIRDVPRAAAGSLCFAGPAFLSLALGASVLFWMFRRRIDLRLRALVLHVRHAVAIGFALLFVGLAGSLYCGLQYDGRIGEALMGSTSVLLTCFGVIFAVYSIKGILDRILSIEEVLDRLRIVIQEINAEERTRGRVRAQGFMLFMGEYPAVGALTFFKDRISADTHLGWEGLRDIYHPVNNLYEQFASQLWKVSIVSTKKEHDGYTEMNRLIIDVGSRFNFLQAEVDAATTFNKELIRRCFNNLGAQRFRWMGSVVGSVPRYQVFILGTFEEKGRRLAAEEALILFALDSPPLVAPATVPDGEGVRHQGGDPSRNAVPILAWQVTDNQTLDNLFHEAMKLTGVQQAEQLFPW